MGKRKIKSYRDNNPYTIKIPKCTGRRFVISDIHGCLNTFKKLVGKLRLTDSDQLFLLGDYVDRGPDSKGVLDYIIELRQAKQVYALRGNHEEDLLALIEFNTGIIIDEFLRRENYKTLSSNSMKLEGKYISFINELPYFVELENVFIVHAGFNFKINEPFSDKEGMVWIRYFDYDEQYVCGKHIIHGHTPFPLYEIEQNIKNKEKIIPLDNGCVFPEIHNYGNLLCLNIDNFELIVQKNVEGA